MSNGTAVAAVLEEAKRQARLNDTLKRAVLEADEAAKRAHAGLAASKTRQDAMRHSARALEQLAEFEKLSNYAHTRRFNPGLLLEETGQKVGLDRLIKPGDRGSTKDLEGTIHALGRLRNMPGTLRPNSSALQAFYESSASSLDKAVTLLRDSALDSASWSRMPEPLFVLLEEVASVPPAAEVVAEQRERLRRMQFEIEELEQRQEDALSEGDMKTMEELYFQRIAVQEAMVGVFDEVFRALDQHAAEAHAHPTKRVHEVHQSTSDDVANTMHRSEALKLSVEEDLARLKKAKAEVDSTTNARKLQADELRDKSDAFLRNNQMQLEQCYAAMEELQKQIGKLAADRSDALEQRLRFQQEVDTFAADAANFNSFFKQHLALLESTLQTIEVGEEVTDLVDEVLCHGCNAVEQRARDNLEDTEKVRLELHEMRLKQFRQLYLTLGDLQYKKERNMEELEKKIEHTHIQQELAMETFNPKAKEYSEAKKALLSIRDEMAAQVQVLADKSTLHIEAFKPTESALISAGKDFVHPVEELATMNQRRQQKLLEYNKLMSTESGGDPDGSVEPDPHRATEEEIAAEVERLEAERRKLQQRSSAKFRQSRSKGGDVEFD